MFHIRSSGGLRRRFTAGLALAALIGVSACGSADNSSTEDDAGDPVAGGTLELAFWPDNGAFSCVDPFQVYWIEHRSLIRNFADSLTDQDPETGEIVPWIAEDWEISEDGLRYTFNLREGVTFSDGAVLDAEAVKTNFDAFVELAELSGGAAFGSSYILGLESTEVIDPQTVELNFSSPNSSFLQATSTTNLALLSPASFEATAEERCLGDVVGSGLFVLDNYTPGEGVQLSKRDGYAWGSELSENTEEAYLDAVNVTYVAEDSVRTGNLVSGAVDIAWPRNPFTVEDQALITGAGAAIESRSLPGPASALFPNVSNERPLSDPDVRQALYKSIDLESYASTIYGPEYPVVEGPFNASTPFFVSQADKLAFDPDGAAELLEAAGWELDDDGYRYRDGEQLTLSNPITVSSPGWELVQDQLRQVGINFELNVITAAERPDVLSNGNYDVVETYFTRADPGALQFILIEELANSKALAANASTPETAAVIADLFAQATETTDQSVSAAAYEELQSLLIDEGVTFPIYERVQFAGVADNIHGFAFTSESFLRLNDVWKSE